MDAPQTPRSQAGPLPTKAGEMGFPSPLSARPQQSFTVDLPAPLRHPADREAEVLHPVSLRDTDAELFVAPRTTKSTGSSELCGVRVSTFVVLTTQVLVLTGTGIAWFFAVRRLSKPAPPTSGNTTGMSANTILIIAHVAFALATLIQLIFMERSIYHLRAERYAYTHRNQQRRLEMRNSGASLSRSMSFAPWNRPPLPTYAFALSQSGHSTGDVEDSRIAIAPPPAYGQTRQTKRLQQGYLSNSMKRARPVSEGSVDIRLNDARIDDEKIQVDADAIEIGDDAAVNREVERIIRSSMDSRVPPTR